MGASFKVDLKALNRISSLVSDPKIKDQLEAIAEDKNMKELTGQAIADVFAQEGPGWKALKTSYAASSLSSSTYKKAKKSALKGKNFYRDLKNTIRSLENEIRRNPDNEEKVNRRIDRLKKDWETYHVEKHVTEHDAKERSKGQAGEPYRMILQKSGTLKKMVTTPGTAGGHIERREGPRLIWGTNLVYAGVHNFGYSKNNIPKREFLKLLPEWKARLDNLFIEKASKIIDKMTKGQS